MYQGDGKGKFLIAAVLIVVALVYFGTQSGKEISLPTVDTIQDGASNLLAQANLTEQEVIIVDTDNDTIGDTTDLCPETPGDDSPDTDGCGETQVNPSKVNACGVVTSGPPNFDGTNDEGKGCDDFPVSERDLKCVANPPKNYDGTIIGSSSSPNLYCCYGDGQCTW